MHPKLRNAFAIGQTLEERTLLAQIIGRGLVDVHRRFVPDDDQLFTWWAPWRQQRERNIGWRLDYILASGVLAERATGCAVVREFGTSDHAPVTAVFDASVADALPKTETGTGTGTAAQKSAAVQLKLL